MLQNKILQTYPRLIAIVGGSGAGKTRLADELQKKLGNETEAQKKQRMKWWTDARFGMFIHWGLYSQAARHEWVKHNEHLTNAEYEKYFDQFDPDHFEPKKWAREAKAAGMKYAVLTTKHHSFFVEVIRK